MDRKILISVIIAVAIVAISITTIYALTNPQPKIVILSPSTAQAIFGGSWQVLQNQTYLKVYPVQNVTIYYANGTNITVPIPQKIRSINHEVLLGNINGTKVEMVIVVAQYTSNITRFPIHLNPCILFMPDRHHYNNFMMVYNVITHEGFMIVYNTTTYEGYKVFYFASTIPRPHTILVAYKGSTLVEVSLNGYIASMNQMEEVLSNI